MRAIKNRAPYSGRKSDYFQDTLIWLTVCHVAEANPQSTVWFVSQNHTDFGDS
jgi:hypothetical protein